METQIKTEPCDDGYFEESKIHCIKHDYELQQNDGFYEEEKFQPNREHFEEANIDENFEEYKFQPDNSYIAESNNDENKKQKSFQENNIKCGEIYWSKIKSCYSYMCSMCPNESFLACKALTIHYRKRHPYFKMRKDHAALMESKEAETLAIAESKKTKADEIHKIALEQLKNLPKNKKYTISKCEKCHKEFRSEQNLLDHLKTHTGKNPLVCIYCGKIFLKLEDLKVHQSKHSGKTPFTCKICGKTFARYERKQHHEKLHT